jgi:hypothetical protein
MEKANGVANYKREKCVKLKIYDTQKHSLEIGGTKVCWGRKISIKLIAVCPAT